MTSINIWTKTVHKSFKVVNDQAFLKRLAYHVVRFYRKQKTIQETNVYKQINEQKPDQITVNEVWECTLTTQYKHDVVIISSTSLSLQLLLFIKITLVSVKHQLYYSYKIIAQSNLRLNRTEFILV